MSFSGIALGAVDLYRFTGDDGSLSVAEFAIEDNLSGEANFGKRDQCKAFNRPLIEKSVEIFSISFFNKVSFHTFAIRKT